MKSIILSLFLVTWFSGITHAGSDQSDYEQAMRMVINQLDSLQTGVDLQVCKNSFERISKAYPDEWLPLYYRAYCTIEIVYWEKESEQNIARLEEAEKLLKQLDVLSGVNQSEVETLWGYYYMCLISRDPMKGSTLFQKTITKFENAIKLNAANPRPVILLAFFEQHLPSFIRTGLDITEYKQKAAMLFEKETTNSEQPFWGKYFLQMVQPEIKVNNK